MSDLQAQVAQIEALRTRGVPAAAVDAALGELRRQHGDPAVDAALKQLHAASASVPAVHMEMSSSDEAQLHNNRQTYVAPGAHLHEAPPSSEAERARRALRDYLRALRAQCRTLQLGVFDHTDARHPQMMSLDQVYVGLHVVRQVELTQAEIEALPGGERSGLGERPLRPLSALEALQQAPARRLMLLGAPGAGKSTFVNHLLVCLVEAMLAPDQAAASEWLARLPGWVLGPLLPVRVILRDFAAHVAAADPQLSPLALFEQHLRATVAPHDAAVEQLLLALGDGKAILLFDGLDEVVGQQVLHRVAGAIALAAGTYNKSPVLVTCRVRDYEDNPGRQLQGFPVEQLAPFNVEQIDLFVEAWYRELAATGRQMLGTPQALSQAIRTRSELRMLASSPLLLTMTAVVHAGKGTLPDARALLYDECVELLLLRWRKEPDSPDILDRLKLPQFRPNDLLAVMAELGFLAHQGAERSTQGQEEPADLSRAQVLQVLERTFERYAPNDEQRRDQLVGIVLREIAQRNGLLLKRSGEQGEQYAFPHRTFQEFLAGYYLKLQQRDYRKLCLERAPHPHWHEALSLMAGYQALKDAEFERPLELVRTLLERTPIEQTLAGELLNSMGRERAAGYDPTVITSKGLWGQARNILRGVTAQGTGPTAPAALRVRAGLALGKLCYGSIEELAAGVRPPLPDPRLPLALAGMEQVAKTPGWPRMLEYYWCEVSPGHFWFGDDRKAPLQQLTLDYRYRIGRFPITNAEYARFIAAGGYDLAQPWWTEHGRDWMQRENRTRPYAWNEHGFNNPLQPVVGVTWYEAAAYCNWLTLIGRQHGWLDAADQIRLPTSLEWEKAARGDDQRRYPWGTQPLTSEHANYKETGIGAPSPIGCFPLGAAPCGALDMLGNTLEWLATPYQKDQQVEARKDFTQNDGVLAVYSHWNLEKEQIFSGARSRNGPGSRNDNRSFRVCFSRSHGF